MIKFFYSKSRDDDDLQLGIKDWRKVLSNFYIYDKNDRFPSIEHEFQYLKYQYSNNPSEGDKIQWNQLTSEKAKSMGTKGEFKKRGIVLNVKSYNQDRVSNMIGLVIKRYHRDVIYRRIIHRLAQLDINLVHYSKNETFWGARVDKRTEKMIGDNYLGRILYCLGRSALNKK
jgi:predicted NAD-dependent protein-ADP-ribosyltransferase YbiA (DUF1768 family)